MAGLLYWLDLAGVAVFAVSGALEAARKQLDIVGFLFVAAVTGLGNTRIVDDHRRALGGTMQRQFAANTAPGAGYRDDLSLKAQAHGRSPVRFVSIARYAPCRIISTFRIDFS